MSTTGCLPPVTRNAVPSTITGLVYPRFSARRAKEEATSSSANALATRLMWSARCVTLEVDRVADMLVSTKVRQVQLQLRVSILQATRGKIAL